MKILLLILITFSLNAQDALIKKAEGNITAAKILCSSGAVGLTASVIYWKNPPRLQIVPISTPPSVAFPIYADYERRVRNHKINRVVFVGASSAMLLLSGYFAITGNLQREIYRSRQGSVEIAANGLTITF
jgi:hypothetical protein